jgi:hypothetical protein
MKNKMYLDVQTDKLWTNDSMALPEDTLGMYGCLITALSNTKLMRGESYSPKILNAELKANKGFAGLRDLNLKNNQSFALWTADPKIPESKGICEILNCRVNHDNSPKAQDIDAVLDLGNGKVFYIIRVMTSYKNSKGIMVNIGHYINLLFISNNRFVCFDTYDGRTNVLDELDITGKIKIEYI